MHNLNVNIKAELKAAGVTQLKIAQTLQISAVSVNDVVAGRRRTPRIREVISWAINKPVNEIWPNKFEEQGP